MFPISIPDRIHISPPSKPLSNVRTYTVFFITGNPGLIGYYIEFFALLNTLLLELVRTSSQKIQFEIYGQSLAGFETQGIEDDVRAGRGHAPLGVEEQIDRLDQALEKLAKEQSGERKKVILIGHSLGSYIALELIRRQRAKPDGISIVGGIGLLATIMDLAGSASGRKAKGLAQLPHFALVASIIVKFLLFFIPVGIVAVLAQKLRGMPKDAAQITASFLKSPRGVRQALLSLKVDYKLHGKLTNHSHLLPDELRTITTDKWDEEIWGAASPSPHAQPRPKIFLYFAQNDHWVADETRDQFIRLRGRQEDDKTDAWKPIVELDKSGVTHDFCLNHNQVVAEKVARWIKEIIRVDTEDA